MRNDVQSPFGAPGAARMGPKAPGAPTTMVPLGQSMSNTGGQVPGVGLAPPQTGGGTPGQANPNGGGNGTPAQATPFGGNYGTFQSFGPGNDLRGTAIMPGQSATQTQFDGMVNRSAQGVDGFQFSPFQSVQQPGFGEERGMLGGANTSMQGLGLNFGGANQSYNNAVGAQQNAQGQAGGMLMGLAGQSGGFGGGGGASANTGRFNQELDASLAGLQGPDRGALAAQTMGLLEERSQPGFEAAQRQTGQRSAALGRMGSGMTTNDLTGTLQDRERMMDQSRRQLATESAGQTLGDRLNVSNFQRGVAGDRFGGETFNAQMADAGQARSQQGAQFGANLQRGIAGDLYGMGQDASQLQMGIGDRSADQTRDMTALGERQAGFQRNVAGDLGNLTQGQFANARGERNTARSDEFDRFGAGIQGLGALSNLQGNQRNFEAGQRQEARGERGYQGDMERQAQGRAVQQQQFNEMMRNSGWNRTMGAGSMGFGNDPSGALAAGAGVARGQAGDMYGMLGNLGQSYGQNRGR